MLAVSVIFLGRKFAGMLGLGGVGGTTLMVGGFIAVVAACTRLRVGWIATRTERKAERGQRDQSLLMFVRAAIRELGACPACGYGVGELAVEEDGCVVCPECGGAWWRDAWSKDGGAYGPPARVLNKNARHNKPAVEDARGVTVALVPERSVREQRRMVIGAIGAWRWTQWAVWVIALIAGAGLLLLVLGVAYFSVGGRGAGIVGGIGGLLGVWAFWATRRTLGWTRGCRTLAAELVREGVCPACEGALREEASFSDGTLICTGCGAAWDRPRDGGSETGIRGAAASV
ncbi:MAG: hypothetical protein R3B49_04170 [Phycisphaerales bacterium]